MAVGRSCGGPSKHVQLTSTDYVMFTTRTFFFVDLHNGLRSLTTSHGITTRELHDAAAMAPKISGGQGRMLMALHLLRGTDADRPADGRRGAS